MSEAERQFWLIVPSCERAALHLQPAEKYRSAAPAVKKVPGRRSGAFRLNLSTAHNLGLHVHANVMLSNVTFYDICRFWSVAVNIMNSCFLYLYLLFYCQFQYFYST